MITVSTARRVEVIGHRGASGFRPEHTAAAYRMAFALGADSVEPDLVATRDGVLVIRHENEISGTTDVAARPEFADRRTTKVVDGIVHDGWFCEDFSWDELSTLRARERLPLLRPESATFDGRYSILRLSELLTLIDEESARLGRRLGLVAEVKHPSYFASIGLPLDELLAPELGRWDGAGRLVVESFEQSVLTRLRERGLAARYVYLIDAEGAAPDLIEAQADAAPSYRSQLSDASLARLAEEVDGISPSALLLLDRDAGGIRTTDVVARAHRAGLSVFTWTLRPENAFLPAEFRRGRLARDWGDWRAAFELILSTEVDGVFADHPDLAVAARERV